MEQVAERKEWERIFLTEKANELSEAGCHTTLYQTDTWVPMLIHVGITLRPAKLQKRQNTGGLSSFALPDAPLAAAVCHNSRTYLYL